MVDDWYLIVANKYMQGIGHDDSQTKVVDVIADISLKEEKTGCFETLATEAKAVHFLNEAYLYCITIAFAVGAEKLLDSKQLDPKNDSGVIIGKADEIAEKFIQAISKHRIWEREKKRLVSA